MYTLAIFSNAKLRAAGYSEADRHTCSVAFPLQHAGDCSAQHNSKNVRIPHTANLKKKMVTTPL